jgi:hypothetical protein
LLRSNQFLLLGQHLWLSNRPLLPPLLQQEALFPQKWVEAHLQNKDHQVFKAFSHHLVVQQDKAVLQ